MTLPLDLLVPLSPVSGTGSTIPAPEATGEGANGAVEEARGAGTTSRPPAVVGLDLSLSASGVAIDNGAFTVALDGLQRDASHWARLLRMRHMTSRVCDHCTDADLVVMEGPAFSKGADPGSHERAGLWWRVYDRLSFVYARRVVVVSPSSLKKYATGKGNAGKAEVVASAIRRLGYQGHDDNECDALWLRAMALDALGHPVVAMPATHRVALEKVSWPELAVRP